MTSLDPSDGTLSQLRAQAGAELRGNILPFWEQYAFGADGWIVGEVSDDLVVTDDGPRHSVLVARILWTFSAASRVAEDEEERTRWLAVAKSALDVLTTACWDDEHGGVFWALDAEGAPSAPRKQVYGQAFTIYGLAEWHAATGDAEALSLAWELFGLLELHARDHERGGYLEALDTDWGPLAEMALSTRDLNVPKSMNTNLHVMEAYTTLLRVTGDGRATEALTAVLTACLDHIYGTEPWAHCRLFFDMDWNSAVPTMSYGHDIEASWLLWEAAEALGDDALMARTKDAALALADAVLEHGTDADGGVLYEGVGTEITEPTKQWWPQAEGVVGWLNAYALSGDTRHRDAALLTWSFIEQCVVAPNGEWYAVLGRDGSPLLEHEGSRKIGPWKCPYHNARACIEVLRRVPAAEPSA